MNEDEASEWDGEKEEDEEASNHIFRISFTSCVFIGESNFIAMPALRDAFAYQLLIC